ncbi:hypothetical protein QM027_13420 [Campylobacter concisus]
MPTIKELLSITDDSMGTPTINKAFQNITYKMSDRGEKCTTHTGVLPKSRQRLVCCVGRGFLVRRQ